MHVVSTIADEGHEFLPLRIVNLHDLSMNFRNPSLVIMLPLVYFKWNVEIHGWWGICGLGLVVELKSLIIII